MEGRRRTIELDESIVDALERGAADRGMTLDEHLLDLNAREASGVIVVPPEELAELDARVAEWERLRDDVSADDVFERLIRRAEQAAREAVKVRSD